MARREIASPATWGCLPPHFEELASWAGEHATKLIVVSQSCFGQYAAEHAYTPDPSNKSSWSLCSVLQAECSLDCTQYCKRIYQPECAQSQGKILHICYPNHSHFCIIIEITSYCRCLLHWLENEIPLHQKSFLWCARLASSTFLQKDSTHKAA